MEQYSLIYSNKFEHKFSIQLHCYFSVARSDLVNTVVVLDHADHSIKLTCDSSRNSSCMWHHGDYTSMFNVAQKLVYNGKNISTHYSGRFRVDPLENNTLCVLYIRSVRITDAGTYMCTIMSNDSSSFSRSAQLIVFGMCAMFGWLLINFAWITFKLILYLQWFGYNQMVNCLQNCLDIKWDFVSIIDSSL